MTPIRSADNNDRKSDAANELQKIQDLLGGQQNKAKAKKARTRLKHDEPSDEEIQKQIRETLRKITR